MYYRDSFSKFVHSQYLGSGVRLTLATIIPTLLFQYYGILHAMIPFVLGTLSIGVIDNPGTQVRRRNTLLAAIGFSALSGLVSVWTQAHPGLTLAALVVLSFFYSIIGVYGDRANSVGTISILVFILTLGVNPSGVTDYQYVWTFVAGGFWYVLIFFLADRLRPYLPAQQLLGENFVLLGELLSIKARFYRPDPDFDRLYDQMAPLQISLNEKHEVIRELLFRTRQIVKESSNKSRTLLLMYLDSLDLFEQIINAHQDYRYLNKTFGQTKILRMFGVYISWLAEEIQHIGVAVQARSVSKPRRDLSEGFHRCELAFYRLRSSRMTQENVDDYSMLRQVLLAMRDITERVKKLHQATRYEIDIADLPSPNSPHDGIVPREDLNPQILLDNLSLESGNFRHALRLTLALVSGHLLAQYWEFGHSHWVLLTIVTIMKPAFGITRQRNLYRIGGTFLGGAIGFMALYLGSGNLVLFLLLIAAMVVSYTFMRINYFVATAGITLYVIIGFYFLNPDQVGEVLIDRLIDTATGSLIAFFFATYVLPMWESSGLRPTIGETLGSIKAYFDSVSGTFSGNEPEIPEMKLHRKNAMIALANISDTFQRMMSEPKKQRVKLEDFHQLVATVHMFVSYVASLAVYAAQDGGRFDAAGFQPKIKEIDRNLGIAELIAEGKKIDRTKVIAQALPQNEELAGFRQMIKKELKETGLSDIQDRQLSHDFSELSTIDGLFELLNTLAADLVKILTRFFPAEMEEK